MLSKVLLGHSVGILHLSTFTLATTVQKKCSWLKIQMSKESLVDYGFPEFVAFMMLFICEQIFIVAKGAHHPMVEERINDTLRVARKYSHFKEKTYQHRGFQIKASNMMSNAFCLGSVKVKI